MAIKCKLLRFQFLRKAFAININGKHRILLSNARPRYARRCIHEAKIGNAGGIERNAVLSAVQR